MFCSYCGKEIADDTVFCPYCGRKLGDDAAPEETAQEAPAAPVEQLAAPEPEPVAEPAPAPEPVAAPAPAEPAPVAPVPAPEATPAPTPQPIQQTPPTAGVAPQPVYGQPPAGATYNPAAPAPKKKSAIPWIILGTLAAVAVVFGISKIIGSGSGSSGTPGTTVESTAFGQLVDANGNPTAYALLELDGQELSDCFKDAGYKWNDSNLWWITGDGNNAAWVSGPSEYEFKEDEILELDVNGSGTPAVFAMALDDRNYSSVDNVLEAIGNVSVIDSYWPDSEACASVVENSAGRRSVLFVIYDGEDELYRISLVNPEGIDRGILEELTGERGNSLDDIWYSYTGNRLPEGETDSQPETPEPSPSEGTHTDPAAAAAVPSGAMAGGSYRVGVDIPAGEYKLYATDEWGGYYTVYSKVGSTDYEDIVVINSFDTCAYIHVLDGQQLDVEGAEFIAFENAEPSSEWTGDGVYRVGFDIPAGQYQLVADDGEWGSYYEIRNSVEASDDYYGSSVVFDSFENNKYVNLSDGQYVMLSNCHIEQ